MKAKCYSGGSIGLNWTDFASDSDVREYSVFYGAGSRASDAVTEWETPNQSNYQTVTGLTPDTRYSFLVKSIDEAGNVSLTGSHVSWISLDDYASWGTLRDIPLKNENPGDATTSFMKVGGYLVANITGSGNGVDLLTLTDSAGIHRVKRLLNKSYSRTAYKGSALYGLAYASGGYQIDIVNLSTPLSPVVTGTLAAEEYARIAVSADGAYLLVALPTAKEVRFYDLSNPTTPVFAGTYSVQENMDSNLLSVSLKDGYLALDCSFQGAHFYSFTSPTSISLAGSVVYKADTADKYVGHKGKYAIFGDEFEHTMTIRDITDIGTVAATVAASPIRGLPHMMGDYLFAEDGSTLMNAAADLYRWDLSTLPSLAAPTITDNAIPAYVGMEYCSQVSAAQYVVWDSRKGQGCVFDVSSPTTPTFGTPFTYSHEYAKSYVEESSALFFAVDANSDLSVIRQSLVDPSASEVTYFKKFTGSFMTGSTPYEQYGAVKVGSSYWLTSGSKLVGLTETAGEFSLATAPGSMLTIANMGSSSGNEIVAGDNLLFVRVLNGITVVDVSTPSAPSVLTTIASPFTGYDALNNGSFFASDGKLYVSCAFELVIYDLSTPSSPAILGRYEYGANGYPSSSSYCFCQDLIVQDGKAYIALGGPSGNSKLLVVNVSDAADPVPLGVSNEYELGYSTSWEANRVRLDGSYCFVYHRDMKFAVIDVQDPTVPNAFSTRSFGNGIGNGYESMYVSADKIIAANQYMDIQYVSE